MLRTRKNRLYKEPHDEDSDKKSGRKFNLTEPLKSDRFDQVLNKYLLRMDGHDLSLKTIQTVGFDKPILLVKPDGLNLKVPPKSFLVRDVKEHVGSDRIIDVMDVKTQKNIQMTMKEFCKYYESKHKDRLLNVISLEFSHTRLDELVDSPMIVKLLDWVDLVWPKALKLSQTESTNTINTMKYPKVQKYCLMSVKGSYTDFHIDFGGTSVWYHIIRGKKVFWMVPPTDLNLQVFEHWTLSGNPQHLFLGDTVEDCFRVELEAGNTFFIPSGWIHAVYTLEDSLVFGGNFLHSFSIENQLRVSKIEDATKVPAKFRYPFYTELMWYVIQHYVHCLTGHDHLHKIEPFIADQNPTPSKAKESKSSDDISTKTADDKSKIDKLKSDANSDTDEQDDESLAEDDDSTETEPEPEKKKKVNKQTKTKSSKNKKQISKNSLKVISKKKKSSVKKKASTRPAQTKTKKRGRPPKKSSPRKRGKINKSAAVVSSDDDDDDDDSSSSETDTNINDDEDDEDSTDIDSSNEEIIKKTPNTCRMTKNSLSRLQYDIIEDKFDSNEPATKSIKLTKGDNVKSKKKPQQQRDSGSTQPSPASKQSNNVILDTTKTSSTTPTKQEQPQNINANNDSDKSKFILPQMMLPYSDTKLNGWSCASGGHSIWSETGSNKLNDKDNLHNGKKIHLTRYELDGLKALMKHLSKLSGTKKNLPSLIRNSRVLLDDCRKMLIEHENDDPALAATGKPITLDLIKSSETTNEQMDMNQLIAQYFKTSESPNTDNDSATQLISQNSAGIKTSPKFKSDSITKQSSPSKGKSPLKIIDAISPNSDKKNKKSTTISSQKETSQDKITGSGKQKQQAIKETETKCLSPKKASSQSSSLSSSTQSPTCIKRPESPPTRPISNNQYRARFDTDIALPNSFADLIAATSTNKTKVYDVSGLSVKKLNQATASKQSSSSSNQRLSNPSSNQHSPILPFYNPVNSSSNNHSNNPLSSMTISGPPNISVKSSSLPFDKQSTTHSSTNINAHTHHQYKFSSKPPEHRTTIPIIDPQPQNNPKSTSNRKSLNDSISSSSQSVNIASTGSAVVTHNDNSKIHDTPSQPTSPMIKTIANSAPVTQQSSAPKKRPESPLTKAKFDADIASTNTSIATSADRTKVRDVIGLEVNKSNQLTKQSSSNQKLSTPPSNQTSHITPFYSPNNPPFNNHNNPLSPMTISSPTSIPAKSTSLPFEQKEQSTSHSNANNNMDAHMHHQYKYGSKSSEHRTIPIIDPQPQTKPKPTSNNKYLNSSISSSNSASPTASSDYASPSSAVSSHINSTKIQENSPQATSPMIKTIQSSIPSSQSQPASSSCTSRTTTPNNRKGARVGSKPETNPQQEQASDLTSPASSSHPKIKKSRDKQSSGKSTPRATPTSVISTTPTINPTPTPAHQQQQSDFMAAAAAAAAAQNRLTGAMPIIRTTLAPPGFPQTQSQHYALPGYHMANSFATATAAIHNARFAAAAHYNPNAALGFMPRLPIIPVTTTPNGATRALLMTNPAFMQARSDPNSNVNLTHRNINNHNSRTVNSTTSSSPSASARGTPSGAARSPIDNRALLSLATTALSTAPSTVVNLSQPSQSFGQATNAHNAAAAAHAAAFAATTTAASHHNLFVNHPGIAGLTRPPLYVIRQPAQPGYHFTPTGQPLFSPYLSGLPMAHAAAVPTSVAAPPGINHVPNPGQIVYLPLNYGSYLMNNKDKST